MKNSIALILIAIIGIANGQSISIDTINWNIQANAYVLEQHKGKDAIYLQGGSITLKDVVFENGTIEYDVYFKKEDRGFPGVYFRVQENGNAEQFYLRPHQSGNPDATQAIPTTRNVTPWQLYHGPKYSFAYEFNHDAWTHVKLVVDNNRAQVYLDWSEEPHLSWNTFHEVMPGSIILTGGNQTGMHIADIKISTETPTINDFVPIQNEPTEGLISQWSISDKFSEELLNEMDDLNNVIESRKWIGTIDIEEGTAANISKVHNLFDGSGKNTSIAKVVIESDRDQLKLFEFGYSDRVLAIFNGKPIYRGTNKFRSRDYRYLGTIGLFDSIYLDLKDGENVLLMVVSEDFGGWLITGRIKNMIGVSIE